MEDTTHRSVVSRNISQVLQEKGLKATTLSEAAGLSRTAVPDIINGRSRSPGIETIEKIAKALNVEPQRLTVGPLSAPLTPVQRRIVEQLSRLDEQKSQKLEGYLAALLDE